MAARRRADGHREDHHAVYLSACREPRGVLSAKSRRNRAHGGDSARRLDSLNRDLVEIKHQFKDRADHLGIIDEVLDALLHKHPRNIPRRDAGH